MQRLGATEHGTERLDSDADEIDLRLLCRELHTGRLGVESEHERLGILSAELLAHDPRPDAASSAELRDLLQQGGAGDEEEGETRRELIDVLAGGQRRTHVLDAVCQREGDLLHGRRPRLGHVIARDRDGVPARDLLAAVGEDVCRQSE